MSLLVPGAAAAGSAALASFGRARQFSRHLEIAGHRAEMWIWVVSSHTLRISLLPVHQNGAVQEPKRSIVLVQKARPARVSKLRSRGETKIVQWRDRRVLTAGNPLRVEIRSGNGKLIQQLGINSQTGHVTFATFHEPVWGLGEGGHQFDRRGAVYGMVHGEHVPDLGTDGARVPIPWVVGAGGWALFFHTPLGAFDLTGKDGVFLPSLGQPVLPLDVFLIAAQEPRQLLREYAQLTGFPHMPPIWALGYQQSHRTLSGGQEAISESETFRRERLPCDVLIYLGTGFCPSGWNMGHGSYEFNTRAFPDPAQMIDRLHSEHFQVVLHEDKPPKQLYGRVKDTGAEAERPEDAACYWKQHLKVFDLGVDGWWADEGDWLSDISCLIRNRMYWEGAQRARPNIRPYTLNRNGYAGVQRYGWLWSGDIDSTWETLRHQVAVGLNIGLSGMPYWGTDTGGFVTTPELTGELYVRWFQFSAFCPLFRSHGRTWKLRLPWGWSTGMYGPVESPPAALPPLRELHNPRVEPICRKYLDLRYRLLPYLYSRVWESHKTGLPILRALWVHYPNDPHAVEQAGEYLWGPDVLIAPVFEKGAVSRRLYLPQGDWYDFWTEERTRGGREITRPIDLATIPIYVRAGAILPLAPVRQYTTEVSSEPLTLVIYPDKRAEMTLYEDDGLTFNFRRGEFTWTQAIWEDSKRRLTLRRRGTRDREKRQFELRVAPEPTKHLVTCEGNTTVVEL